MELKVKVAQSCPTLCDPMDYTAHEILQARILEWIAFPFSRESSQPGNLPSLGIKPRFPTLNPGLPVGTDSVPTEPQGKPNCKLWYSFFFFFCKLIYLF